MNIWVKIGLILIVLHLIAGFGWLAYKLSPRKNDTIKDTNSKEESDSADNP